MWYIKGNFPFLDPSASIMVSSASLKRGKFLFCLVLLQLATFNLAQITFTREWVAGKRSFAPPMQFSGPDDEEGKGCSAIRPFVEFLYEYKRVVEELCGWKIGFNNQNKMNFLPTTANIWRDKKGIGKNLNEE